MTFGRAVLCAGWPPQAAWGGPSLSGTVGVFFQPVGQAYRSSGLGRPGGWALRVGPSVPQPVVQVGQTPSLSNMPAGPREA